MADLVESILQSAAEKESKLKTTDVQKDVDVDIDEGNLLANDPNPLDIRKLKSDREAFLQNLTRGNTQLLLNNIWKLPVERVEDAITCKLPDPKTRLPREKPIPAAKPLTKWQQYQKDKGFQKRKKERMIWDDERKEWRPRWGYKRINDINDKWVLEVPENADPYEDQFGKLKKEKRERVAKNELQRLRNIARNMKGKMPGVGLVPTPTPGKEHVTQALHEAKTSDASLGRFSQTLAKEKPAKNMGKKRKFEPNYSSGDKEKQRSLDILGKLQNKKPKLDVTRAVNAELHKSEVQRAQSKQGKGKGQGPKGKGPKGKQMKMQHAKAGGGGKKGKGAANGRPMGGGNRMKGPGGAKKGGMGKKK